MSRSRKLGRGVLFVLGLGVGAGVCAAQEPTCSDEVEETQLLLLQNEAASAVERLGALMRRTDLTPECRNGALLVLAEAEEALGFFEQSAKHWRELEAAVQEGEDEIEVLRGVAGIEKKLGNFARSLEVLERLYERHPDLSSVALDIVETAQAMGDELGAARRLMQLREKGPDAVEFEYYQRFDLVDSAVGYLEALVKTGQANAFERMELARLYQDRGQVDEATETALGLEKEQPAAADVQALLGSLYLAKGDLDRSVQHYERSLDLGKGQGTDSSLEGLGEVFFQKGDREKAIRLWSRLVQPGPRQTVQRLDLARIYREHGLYDEARDILLALKADKSVRLPQDLYVRQLADTYYIVGETGKALAELLGMVEQDPLQLDLMEAELQRMLAEDLQICEPLGQLEPAPKGWAGHLFVAQGLEFCGKHREATWHYLQSYLLRNQVDFVATLFRSLVRDGRYEEAAWLEGYLVSKPVQSVHVIYYQALLAEKTGRAEQADKLYQQYLAKTAQPAGHETDRGLYDDALFHRGCLLIGPLKRPAEGSGLLTDLILRFPGSTLRPEAEQQLGLALYREGQPQEAIRHLDAIGPTNPLALELLGQIHLAQGEVEKARVTLRTALAQYPEQLGSQPGLLSLLQVLRLMDASKEEAALVSAYRKALLMADAVAAEATLMQLGQHEAWRNFARLEMAQLAEQQGRKEEAIELYAALAVAEVPDWVAASAVLRLDSLYTAAGQFDRAIAVLEKVILEHPRSPRVTELRQRLTDRKASAASRQQASP